MGAVEESEPRSEFDEEQPTKQQITGHEVDVKLAGTTVKTEPATESEARTAMEEEPPKQHKTGYEEDVKPAVKTAKTEPATESDARTAMEEEPPKQHKTGHEEDVKPAVKTVKTEPATESDARTAMEEEPPKQHKTGHEEDVKPAVKIVKTEPATESGARTAMEEEAAKQHKTGHEEDVKPTGKTVKTEPATESDAPTAMEEEPPPEQLKSEKEGQGKRKREENEAAEKLESRTEIHEAATAEAAVESGSPAAMEDEQPAKQLNDNLECKKESAESEPQTGIDEEAPAKRIKNGEGENGQNSDISPAPGEPKSEQEEERKNSIKALPSDLSGVVSSGPRVKTSLCSYFRKGNCRHGDQCRYAHGEAELQPRPDGTWDPTSDIAKAMAREAEATDQVKVVAPVSTAEESENDSVEAGIKKCLQPVQRRWAAEQLKKFLTESNIEFLTCKKRKGETTAFVGFQDEAQVEKAKKILEEKMVSGHKILVKDVLPRAWEKKANDDMDTISEGLEGVTTRVKTVCDAVTPLGHLSYEDQLSRKRDDIEQVLKRLARNTRKGLGAGVLMPDWLLSARDNGGLPCTFEGVLASPLVDGYRNKCEFSIGCAVDGTRTVGFQLGSFREGIIAVAEPEDCKNVSSTARSFAAIFQKFVQASDLPVWNKTNNRGFWRMLTVREGRGETSGVSSPIVEVMLVVQVCPTGVEKETMSLEYEKMAAQVSEAAAAADSPLPITALVVQEHTGVSNAAPANAPLHALPIPGKSGGSTVDYIHDHIGKLKFRISPTAFFQVNTLAAERLYSLAGDWAELSRDTLLFDVCCGTGTIGLTLAHRVGMVVGIEMNESAVADAKKNAELNNITNCRFVASKAEDVMERLLKEYSLTEDGEEEEEEENPASEKKAESGTTDKNDRQRFKNIVAIVDPPRVGLHPIVLKTLRLHTQLRRLVYISCNPQSLLANAVELCTPLNPESETEKGKGRGHWKNMGSMGLARSRLKKMPPSTPFNPKRAMAVDLFPHTSHCEMVMLFER